MHHHRVNSSKCWFEKWPSTARFPLLMGTGCAVTGILGCESRKCEPTWTVHEHTGKYSLPQTQAMPIVCSEVCVPAEGLVPTRISWCVKWARRLALQRLCLPSPSPCNDDFSFSYTIVVLLIMTWLNWKFRFICLWCGVLKQVCAQCWWL